MDLKITCHINSIQGDENSFEEETKVLHELSEESTFSEILTESELQNGVIELVKYYPKSHDFMKNYPNVLPYLLIDGKYRWNVPASNVKVKDFCETHSSVKENGLVITSKQVYDLGGDPDLVEYIIQLWGNYSASISGALILAGDIISKKSIINKIIKMFKENNMPAPSAMEEVIFSREKWNHYDLAERLDIEPENAKLLLKGFGYKWLNDEKLYANLPVDSI